MNQLELRRPPVSESLGPVGPMNTAPPTVHVDMPGPGLKRDYSGFMEYWQMVRRHKFAVAAAALIGGVIGFGMTLSSPRVYQARATLEIQGLNQDFLNMKTLNPVSDASSYLDGDIQTQVRLLESGQLSKRVYDKLKLANARPRNLQPPDRLGMWRKALGINPPTQDQLWEQALGTAGGGVRVRASGLNRIVEVSCDSTNGTVAADFCNTLSTEFIDQNLESRWKTTEYTGEWLQKQLQDLKIKMEKQSEELQSYARETGIVNTAITAKGDEQDGQLTGLEKALAEARADRIGKQSTYEMVNTSNPGALAEVLDDPSLKDQQKALADLKTRAAQLKVVYTPEYSEVKKVDAQIKTIEDSLASARTNVLTRIKKEYDSAKRKEDLLQAEYASQARQISGKAEERAHYAILKGEVDATHTLYDSLMQRLKEASIASAMRANNIRVVDPAQPATTPYRPNARQQATTGLIFGLAIGIAFAVFRERADRTLQDPGDLSYYLGVPELGVVPVGELLEGQRVKKSWMPSRSLPASKSLALTTDGATDDKIEIVAWRQNASLLAESFRTTVTSILFSNGSGPRPQVLVLTSASPKEGKTTVVSNLSISMAEISHKVLLIDADMRRPRQHTVFGVDNRRGLSDLLIEREALDKTVFEAACTETSVPGLSLMTAGTSARSAASLVHSPRLPEVLAIARTKFDTIIIDTPPMINMADARVVAKLADGLILVVRSGSTTRDAALLAKARFTADGIPVMGTILNFWNPKTPGYSYYKHYYAGYYNYYGNGSAAEEPAGNGHGNGHPRPSLPQISRASKPRPLADDPTVSSQLSDGPASNP